MQDARRQRYLRALDIGETWRRRDAQPLQAQPEPPPAVPAAAPPQVPAVASHAITPAVAEAPSQVPTPSGDWSDLRRAVQDCRACRLCETRTQTVFGVGPERAPLMVVGEGPGADEDARGEPFVGRAGKLLDEMLKAIGHSRASNTYIANVVKCRPPANREPAEDEAEACRGFLEQQLRLVQPKLILALGRVAAQRLLMTDTPLAKLRGPLHHWGPEGTPLMVTYHPAYLLRSPGDKAKSWQDLKQVHRFLNRPS